MRPFEHLIMEPIEMLERKYNQGPGEFPFEGS